MKKLFLFRMDHQPKDLLCLILLGISFCLFSCQPTEELCEGVDPSASHAIADSLTQKLKWPDDLKLSYFAGPELTPSPACLAAAPTGEVFVGVDMMGSLGKLPDRGKILRLIDCNRDGVADEHTVFAIVDNPRGLLPIGDQLFVLYTTFAEGKASGMDLVVFEDKDHDGIADGPSKPLIQNISSPKFLQDRGTDHSTNGIRMGIDGWIYIAVGDFGFHDAVDREGTKMTMLGGGIVRVRPDGTEMEVYTHGLRNIYDMAIDPYMNIFTRGNTNDGGGWDIRFVHHIQSGEYGYPVLFKHFTDEILPALADVGGGSGTGAYFMDEPGWPKSYNQVPLMADWGRNKVFAHRVSTDGASFTQADEPYLNIPQITDLDMDGSGRMYASAWDGAGYRGDSSKGFVVRTVPVNWKYKAFPDFRQLSPEDLGKLMGSKSAEARFYASQELIRRGDEGADIAWKVAADKKNSLATRVAGIFTYAQSAKANGIENLVELTQDEKVREFALRALADRKKWKEQVPLEPFLEALNDKEVRVQIAAMVGLGRLGRIEAATALLKTPVPVSAIAPAKGNIGLHATTNAEIIPAHIAVRALVALNAVEACVEALDGENPDLALWVLRYMHDEKAVEGLIAAFEKNNDPVFRQKIISTLSRIYHKEAPYDGSWWWSTRPDTHGPYYKTMTWEGSDRIKSFLVDKWEGSSANEKVLFADLNGKHRMEINEFGGSEDVQLAEQQNQINLGRIANKKGQVERASIEDVMLAIADIKGDPAAGAKLFTQQGCVACHSLRKEETMKGPFMGQVGAILSRDQIAESILKPNASISQGFASVLIQAKGNKSYAGFISEESANQLTLRNIAGHVFRIEKEDIISRKELESSMMPKGLANSLSFVEFASLVDFLVEQKE